MNIDDFKKAGVPWPTNNIGDGAPYVDGEFTRDVETGEVTSGRFKTTDGKWRNGTLFRQDDGTRVWFIGPSEPV